MGSSVDVHREGKRNDDTPAPDEAGNRRRRRPRLYNALVTSGLIGATGPRRCAVEPRGHVRPRVGRSQGRVRSGALAPAGCRAGPSQCPKQPRGHVRPRRGRSPGRRRSGALVPAGCRAGRRQRPVQTRAHVRQRRGRSRGRGRSGALVPLAAEQGHASAQYSLGFSYADGEGVLEVPAALAEQYGLFPEEVGSEEEDR